MYLHSTLRGSGESSGLYWHSQRSVVNLYSHYITSFNHTPTYCTYVPLDSNLWQRGSGRSSPAHRGLHGCLWKSRICITIRDSTMVLSHCDSQILLELCTSRKESSAACSPLYVKNLSQALILDTLDLPTTHTSRHTLGQSTRPSLYSE